MATTMSPFEAARSTTAAATTTTGHNTADDEIAPPDNEPSNLDLEVTAEAAWHAQQQLQRQEQQQQGQFLASTAAYSGGADNPDLGLVTTDTAMTSLEVPHGMARAVAAADTSAAMPAGVKPLAPLVAMPPQSIAAVTNRLSNQAYSRLGRNLLFEARPAVRLVLTQPV